MELTDNEINNIAKSHNEIPVSGRAGFILGCKWYRDEYLKKKKKVLQKEICLSAASNIPCSCMTEFWENVEKLERYLNK